MPKATVDIQSTERHELKSCPEGFVVRSCSDSPFAFQAQFRRKFISTTRSISGAGKAKCYNAMRYSGIVAEGNSGVK